MSDAPPTSSVRRGVASGSTRSLENRPGLRLAVLCVLYVGQGIPWGFTAVTLPAYLASAHVDAGSIARVLAMTTLPYSFKWMWGPVMDAFTIRRFGRRRPWIIFAQGMMALTIAALLWWSDPTHDTDALALMVCVHTVFSSIQDVAVDGLAVDLLPVSERGRASGFTYASKYAGGMLGGAGLSRVISHAGLRTALVVQAALLLAIMVVPILVRERAGEAPPTPRVMVVVGSLVRAFSLRSTIACAALVLTMNLALGLLSGVGVMLYIGPLRWSTDRLTSITGGIGLAVGLVGSAVAGITADRIGHRRLAGIASLVLAGGWIAFAAARSTWGGYGTALGFAVVEQVAASMMTVAVMAVCMDVSWPRVGASQFAAYMALMNFSTTIGVRMVGPALGRFSYAEIYVLAAGAQILATCVLLAIDPTQTRRELPVDVPPTPDPDHVPDPAPDHSG